MLLSIDVGKVKARLEETVLPFRVTSCNLEVHPSEPHDPQEPVHIFSTVAALPPDLERARARLQALRQTVVETSDDGLDRAIDAIRGR